MSKVGGIVDGNIELLGNEASYPDTEDSVHTAEDQQ